MSSRYLVFGGKTGWIGQKVLAILQANGFLSLAADSRLQNIEQVAAELDRIKPTHVLNCAGLTGRPNVDWCEEHKEEVVRVNVVGTLGLLDACEIRGIHCTNFSSGCIYTYDDKHAVGGEPIPEEYAPNFFGSFYSLTKGMVDKLAPLYRRCLTLRLRMPISDDLSERSFLTKIASYARVIDVPNSVTILHDLLPVALSMAERGVVGTFNFINPGTISHNECLALYKEIIDPDLWYANFSEEEQSKVLKAGRCNCFLATAKLEAAAAVAGMPVPHVKDALRSVLLRMKDALLKEGSYPPPPRKGPRPTDPTLAIY